MSKGIMQSMKVTVRGQIGVAGLSLCLILQGCAQSPSIERGDQLLEEGDQDRAIVVYRDAGRESNRRALANAKIAQVYIDQGRPKDALDIAKEAVAMDGNEVRANIAAGRALQAMEEPEESLAYLRRAVELDPACADCCFWLALSLSDLRRDEEASAWWEKAAELQPENWSYRLNVAINRKRLDRPEEAVAELRKVLSMKGHTADQYRQLVSWLYDLNKDEEACAAASEGLAEFPESPVLLRLHSGCELNKERGEEALIIATKAAELDPKNWRSWVAVAHAERALGHTSEAAEAWKKSLELNPDLTDERLELATLLRTHERVPEAKEQLEYLAKSNSDSAEVYFRLAAICREHDQDLAKAEEMILRALALTRESDDVFEYAGIIFELKNDRERAYFYYSEALRINPKRPIAQTGVGVVLLDRFGRPTEALEHFEIAAEHAPSEPIIWHNIASARVRLKQWKEAEEAIRKAISLESNATRLLLLGQCLSEQRKLTEAVEVLRKSLELEPENATAWNSLGVAQLREEKLTEANVSFEKAMELSDEIVWPRFNRALIAIEEGDLKTASRMRDWLKTHDAAMSKDIDERIRKAGNGPEPKGDKQRF